MKIATSPFVYRWMPVFMPEKNWGTSKICAMSFQMYAIYSIVPVKIETLD